MVIVRIAVDAAVDQRVVLEGGDLFATAIAIGLFLILVELTDPIEVHFEIKHF